MLVAPIASEYASKKKCDWRERAVPKTRPQLRGVFGGPTGPLCVYRPQPLPEAARSFGEGPCQQTETCLNKPEYVD